jgi:hypothetical protein
MMLICAHGGVRPIHHVVVWSGQCITCLSKVGSGPYIEEWWDPAHSSLCAYYCGGDRPIHHTAMCIWWGQAHTSYVLMVGSGPYIMSWFGQANASRARPRWDPAHTSRSGGIRPIHHFELVCLGPWGISMGVEPLSPSRSSAVTHCGP